MVSRRSLKKDELVWWNRTVFANGLLYFVVLMVRMLLIILVEMIETTIIFLTIHNLLRLGRNNRTRPFFLNF